MRRLLIVATMVAATALTACSSADDAGSANAPSPQATATAVAQAPAAEPSASTPADAGPVDEATGGLTEFFDPGSGADAQVLVLRDQGKDEAADLVQMIADEPIGVWLGVWTGNPTTTIESASQRGLEANQIPIFIVYNIPGRDCGLYSAGGTSEEYYLTWIQKIADGVTPGSVTWFILEPDALPQLGDCEGQGDRVHLLSEAARILDEAGGRVFLDVGHSNWETTDTMAERIAMVGTEHLTGFATNTSNYNATENEVAWGTELSEKTGLRFITDTSRNGNGAPEDAGWCNPRGRALGERPVIFGDGGPLIAYVWGKVPGESDGECNGGPAAGKWWQEIAEELARNA